MDLVLAVSQVGLTVTLLAHQAWLMTDAIVRTLFRVYVTRRKLLEWVTAAQAKSGFDITLGSVYRCDGRGRSARRGGSYPRPLRAAGSMAGCGAVRISLGAITRRWHTGSACRRARPGRSRFRKMTLACCG